MSYSETTLFTLGFREALKGLTIRLEINGTLQDITIADIARYDGKTNTFMIHTEDGDIIPIGGDTLIEAKDSSLPSGTTPSGKPTKPRDGGRRG